MRLPIVLATALFALSGSATAADPPGKLTLTTQRVIVFKDGYCLVIKQGEATTDEKGEVYLDEVPDAAVLGSFWAAPAEGRLVNMVAGWREVQEDVEKPVACTQTIELLLANKGQQAKVELQDKAVHSGVIHEVLVERTTTALTPTLVNLFSASRPPARAAVLSEGEGREAGISTTTAIQGNLFVLRTDAGDLLLPASQVRSLLIKDMQTTLPRTVTTKKQVKRLTMQFDKVRQKHTINLLYFRPDVRWIPTYRVDINGAKDKKQAKVSLQAELLNEAEDLIDVPLDIVVGVPNFRFKDTPSPLVLEGVLRNVLASSNSAILANGNNAFSNSIMTQQALGGLPVRGANAAAADAPVIDLPAELTAAGAQDLFIYNLPKLSLAKGERAAVSIFTAEVPYRDVYTWDVQVSRHDIEAAPSGAGVRSPLKLARNEVWHQIELTNTTNLPWTTGSALLAQGQQPLAQELLTYTPRGGGVRLPVTVSVETRGTFEEHETGRDLKALVWDARSYARIEKEARLRLDNYKPAPIEAEITFRLGGRATAATQGGQTAVNAFNAEDWVQYHGSPAVNNSSTVTWTVTLQPGETLEPTARYHFFARH
jgi:hypothetical protein